MQAEQSYPLSPVQKGMLYHHLSAPRSGVDIEQMVALLRRPVDTRILRQAWERLLNRHAVLRSTFEWENRPQPVQVEHAHVCQEWEEIDLRRLRPEERRQSIEAFLARDRDRGFDLQVAPLSRVTVFRTDEREQTLVWTFHHILADGYSYPALLREVFAWYEAIRDGRELTLPPPRPYREFIAWLERHLAETRPQAERFWRERLRDFTASTPLPAAASAGAAAGHGAEQAGALRSPLGPLPLTSGVGEKTLRLSAKSTAALADLARAQELTMSTLVQAGWALVLAANSGEEDVVFGVTRSCRHSSLPGAAEMVGVFINTVPLRVPLPPHAPLPVWLKELRASQKALRSYEHTPLVDIQRWSQVPPGSPLFESIVVFTPRLIGAALQEQGGDWVHREITFREQTNYPVTLFAYHENELLLKLAFERSRCSESGMERCLELLGTLLESLPLHPEHRLSQLPLLSGRQRHMLLTDWNATSRDYAKDRCIHELFEAQVERTPSAPAVVFRTHTLSYEELNRRANQLARRLQSLGAGPGQFVALFLRRSPDLVVALLATLKAGAAYVPMDPAYPRHRLALMLEDTRAAVVLTQRDLRDALPPLAGQIVCLDDDGPCDWRAEAANLASGVRPGDLAYVIFTSGSSGRPKGVMVEHRNVSNYFTGMDDCLDFKEPGTWLAVTSISFDISVQELLWTLTRGFKVVLQEEMTRAHRDSGTLAGHPTGGAGQSPGPAGAPAPGPCACSSARAGKMDFSLFYFAADSGEATENKYRLLIEGARYADQHGFTAVWTPERHFHAFGGLYPNPALTSALIAALTSRVQLRAGSVVLPLHNPIRVAEEWSVVDNFSRGRVGLSFASGWHANDFALMPQNYQDRKEILLRGIDTIRRLWRGEAVAATSGTGETIAVRLFPAPVQREPPIWLTSAGNVETFRTAGRMGFNVLTNLLGQEIAELAEKIAAYRAARQEQGHSGTGQVTLMLHTFVGPDLDQVRRKVRKPFLDYLKTSTDLIKKARWECPAFATSPNRRLAPFEEDQLSDAEMQALLDHAFERYFRSSGLFGTPEMCLKMVERLREAGVDEIACLIDFGVDSDAVLESLRYLNEVRERSNPATEDEDYSIPAQIRRHGVTHLQCTPSLARILASDPDSLRALRPLRKLLVGGEALPPALAAQLAPALEGDLINVYGPTETTIWSTAAHIDKSGGPVTIGRPIANTQIYIVDRHLRPVPIGVAGEVCIGGCGVARGYLNRPDLTEERFVPDPFRPEAGGRLYRTGDLARYREDGQIEFLGRLDHQVKIRGYRIELGEIEAVLARHPAVRECVVVAREQAGGEQSLCAYVAVASDKETASLRPEEPSPCLQTAARQADEVASWRKLWDAAYAGSEGQVQAAADPALNRSGWVSSYTGQLIPEAEMREWAEHTAGRLLALKPRRVLEIGCGTGMLLFRLAPHCEHYDAVDFSALALGYVEKELTRQGIGNVTLRQAAAHELQGLKSDAFDLIVMNSVVQYFPSADYLVGVLESIVPLANAGGTIFIGDVRSLPLHDAFHTSVALEQAPASLSAAEVRLRARQRLERDDELVLDPMFFQALPQQLRWIGRVAVHLKRGRHRNELTRFRYDVFLALDTQPAAARPWRVESGATITLTQICQRLAAGLPVVAFTGIPNPRVANAVRAVRLLASADCPATAGAIRQQLASEPESGVDPEDLYELQLPYALELTWSEEGPDRYDAVFRQRGAPAAEPAPAAPPVSSTAWQAYSNRGSAPGSRAALAVELKELVKEQLPDFMVPATIILVDALPRTPNGKIDRKALPPPGGERPVTPTRYCAPASALEQTIAAVWQELLQLERVGTHDNFFDLGANSLLMVQANSRLRAALRRDLSLVDLFRYPTVSALAAHLSRTAPDATALIESQERGRARLDALQRRRAVPRSGALPR